MIVLVFLLLLLPLGAGAQQPTSQQLFRMHCGSCHGDDAKGTAQGPALALNPRVAEQSPEQLRAFLEHGNPAAGMPSFADLTEANRASLAGYLHSINVETILRTITVTTTMRKIPVAPPQAGDWVSYNGNDSGNRYSALKQITAANVAKLKVKWIFPTDSSGLETTPLETGGVLYFTGTNQVFAIDALTGEAIWHYSRPASAGMVGDPKLGINRGAAILRERIFFITDNAHLVALDRTNGKLLWETPLAPADVQPNGPQPYGATMAPLVVGDNVIAGVTGADHGIRGFVAAFHGEDGKLAWRRFTVPLRGEPGIESWQGKEPIAGGGSTWLTGSYDAASDTLYWATGNPWPDSDDKDRPGDNLYTDCVLALNPATGAMKWYYQFTPHDLKDRDATEPNVLADMTYHGVPAKVLLHADRNGFFYVIDRMSGKVLMTKSFLHRDDWASSIGADGRPVVTDPRGCPSDAANWDSTAYSPTTHLYYFMALEECTGRPTGYPDQTGEHFLRALNIETGEIAWDVAQPGPARAKTWSGVMATAGGVVFYGKPNGGFAAVDERSGKGLWEFPTNARMKASPMTFSVDGQQYVVVAAGPNVICFGL